MAKKVVIYRDKFGGEHESEEAADRASSIEAATRQFEESAAILSRLILMSARTGDGVSFADICSSGMYYHVRRFIGARPTMQRVFIWPHDCRVVKDCDSQIRYRAEIHEANRNEGHSLDVRICDLYQSQPAAEQRYCELLRELIAELQDELQQLKDKGKAGA